ncbi:hypothetical protein DLEV_137 [Diachasmimorpha longicaudata entomopoxvirus]|uniref:Uncharacterized protein n=1 Tax=Diachasmimorpha longicaudata entomopoxvirus TaxID=109981 RepID=A0A7R5WS48_9POXV|nr:hypothetical protein QKK69_gp137 [Diachasmimorpha longicaudata entomopoxvirus]AKS26428.1 hypothetical protein DLEV_137 [Diachasmimorpha longicaudata entomopoxvirus]
MLLINSLFGLIFTTCVNMAAHIVPVNQFTKFLAQSFFLFLNIEKNVFCTEKEQIFFYHLFGSGIQELAEMYNQPIINKNILELSPESNDFKLYQQIYAKASDSNILYKSD